MKQGKPVVICEQEFRRLWSAGLSRVEMATHFQCSVSKIDHLRTDLGLTRRFVRCQPTERLITDPTPEEIEIRKREIRQRNDAAMRGEKLPTTLEWRKSLTRSA